MAAVCTHQTRFNMHVNNKWNIQKLSVEYKCNSGKRNMAMLVAAPDASYYVSLSIIVINISKYNYIKSK